MNNAFDLSNPHFFPYVDIKSSHEVSLIDTEPCADLSISIQPLMYRASNFLNITTELEETNVVDIEEEPKDDLIQELKKHCDFRFLKKNTFIFQVTSNIPMINV